MRPNPALIVVCGCLCVVALSGATGDGQPDPAAEVARGEELYRQSKFAQARDAAARAREWFASSGNLQGVGRANHLHGLAADSLGETADAIVSFRQAIAAFEQVGNRRGRARATLGLLRVDTLAAAEEEVLLQRVVEDATAAGDISTVARAFHSWGDHAFNAAAFETALLKYDDALVHFQRANDMAGLGTLHNSIGRLYRAHGRLDLALAEQLKALALHEKAPSRFYLLQSLNAVAVTYQALGDLARARPYFERALRLAEQSESIRIQDFVRANFSGVLLEQGDYAAAALQLETVLANQRDSYPSVRYRDLSEVYSHLGRHEDALRTADLAVERCDRGGASCIYGLEQRAKAHAALGNRSAALKDLHAALAEVERRRAQLIPQDFLKQQFSAMHGFLYSTTIAMQMAAGETSAALETAELARSRAFVDLLAGNGLRPASAIPEVVHRGEIPAAAAAPLDPETLALTRPLDAQALAATARRLNSTLLAYWMGRDELFIWVMNPAGSLHTARVAVTPARLRDLLRATQPPDSPGDAGPASKTAAITTRGDAQIALAMPRSTAWTDLYRLLIAPVRTALPTSPGALLTIVPHGVISGLSFAALQNERGRYLVEDYALHYVPAASVLPFTAAKRRPDARLANVSVIADPQIAPRSRLNRPLPPLPGARAEAAAIRRLLPAGRTTTLSGRDASEDRVRTQLAQSAVIHFATHAIVDDNAPFSSFLALAATGGAAPSDGTLTAGEVYGLRLTADLVVLSACRSGAGLVMGDGIAAFVRAFIYAGAASLLTSLWDVADEPTHRLLPPFYRAWLGGASKAAALRAAQLLLLRELRAGRVTVSTPVGAVTLPEHPAFWAGFALIGEPD